jgi:integrase
MLVSVKQAKGSKDRYTLLSKTVLKELRIYYKKYKPQEYLFQGHPLQS